MLNERLRRVTDLFVEGIELYMGMAGDGSPIVVWVNKLNSFEADEARRDGAAARSLRATELGPESSECQMLKQTISGWSDDKLAKARCDQKSDELYLRALNDLDTEERFRSDLEMIRRGKSLLDDEGVPEDDPRRENLANVQTEYIAAVQAAQQKVRDDEYRDQMANARSDNEADYIEAWRNDATIDIFIAERRVTELYRALRDCKAKVAYDPEDPSKRLYDHTDCDHSVRICTERAEVRALPDDLVRKAVDKLDEITVGPRDAGNSDAPASSSASLEPTSVAEEASTGSTPEEIPSEPVTT